MGRRYYCEYCNKTFIDELEARKKHLQSANHIKLRNLHYEQCREPAIILKEELLKIPCRKFFHTGTCLFEGGCKYTHYLPEQLCELRQQVDQLEFKRQKLEEERNHIPSIDSWLEKYERTANKGVGNSLHTPWTYPDNLASRLDLPPSLVKFRPEHFHDDNFEEWGI
ncbi:zinc finger matrin-type protein 5 [Euwallacea similis]|uniref:zinc finger matrin-type protein 5 n=1 Tax=Euwallacea similis TaxID=1736056 RepID=UPI00344E2138